MKFFWQGFSAYWRKKATGTQRSRQGADNVAMYYWKGVEFARDIDKWMKEPL